MGQQSFTTVEEAQAHILDLNEQIAELTNERDTLSQNNNNLTSELEQVKALNQKYFNKLSAQFQDQEDKTDNEPEVQSCEDYAKTIKL